MGRVAKALRLRRRIPRNRGVWRYVCKKGAVLRNAAVLFLVFGCPLPAFVAASGFRPPKIYAGAFHAGRLARGSESMRIIRTKKLAAPEGVVRAFLYLYGSLLQRAPPLLADAPNDEPDDEHGGNQHHQRGGERHHRHQHILQEALEPL